MDCTAWHPAAGLLHRICNDRLYQLLAWTLHYGRGIYLLRRELFNIPEISRKRRLCGVAIIALIYITTVWLVYAPAPLDTLITTVDANYEDGSSTVIGVPWKSDYWPVNIRIGNDTDHVYDGYDAYIRTEYHHSKGRDKKVNKQLRCVIGKSLSKPF